MLVKMRNVGDAPRVMYDKSGRKITIGVGKEMQADIHEVLHDRLRDAQDRGDTLKIARVAEPVAPGGKQRVRVRAKEKGSVTAPAAAGVALVPEAVEVTPKAVDVLKKASELDYHTLLALVGQIVPDNKLPPRPTMQQMLEVLRAASVLEEDE